MRWPWVSRRKLERYLDSQMSGARELSDCNATRRPQLASFFDGSLQALHDVRGEFVGPFEVAARHFERGGVFDTIPAKASNEASCSERIEVSPHWHVEGELDSTSRRNIERIMENNARELRRKQEEG